MDFLASYELQKTRWPTKTDEVKNFFIVPEISKLNKNSLRTEIKAFIKTKNFSLFWLN